MDYTTLGRTGLKVSVAGLGCGGNSRLGLATGKTEADAVKLILAAIDLGVNLIDTAAAYGTEAVVGEALRGVPRDKVVVCTKVSRQAGEKQFTPEWVVQSLDNSLRTLGLDYIDVFQLHAVPAAGYEYVRDAIAPVLLKEREKGKFRHLGITETAPNDPNQDMLYRAVRDPQWETAMIAFHMMHQVSRERVFPATRANGVGTLLMFAVRSIFARPEHWPERCASWRRPGRCRRRWPRATSRSGFWCMRAAPVRSPTRRIATCATSRVSMSCCSAPAIRRICGRTSPRSWRRRCRRRIVPGSPRCSAICVAWGWTCRTAGVPGARHEGSGPPNVLLL